MRWYCTRSLSTGSTYCQASVALAYSRPLMLSLEVIATSRNGRSQVALDFHCAKPDSHAWIPGVVSYKSMVDWTSAHSFLFSPLRSAGLFVLTLLLNLTPPFNFFSFALFSFIFLSVARIFVRCSLLQASSSQLAFSVSIQTRLIVSCR